LVLAVIAGFIKKTDIRTPSSDGIIYQDPRKTQYVIQKKNSALCLAFPISWYRRLYSVGSKTGVPTMPPPPSFRPLSYQLSDLINRRRLLGEKYKDIAAKAGVHPTQISRLANRESGVSLDVLDKLGLYLGLEIVENRPGSEASPVQEDERRQIEVLAFLEWLRRESREHAEEVWQEARRRLLVVGEGDHPQPTTIRD
jgi:transcriptional regulator with XRE-family HTH domain